MQEGDEVITTPFSFVASANAVLYERARPVFATSTRARSTSTPRRPRPRSATRTTGALPVHIFGYPADMPGFERLARSTASDRRGRLRGARRGPRRRHAGRRSRQPRRVRLLPEQAADHGRGRAGHARRRRSCKERSTPSATRAARPTWAGSTTTGSASTTASTTSPARSASRSSSASTTCSPAARGGRAYREALGGHRGSRAALPGRGRRPARLVRLRGPAAARRRPRRRP